MITDTQRRRLTSAVFATMVFLAFNNTMGAPLFSYMIDSFHLEDAAQGYAGAAGSVGGLISLLSSFLVMGRVSKVTLLKLVVGIAAISLVFLWFAPVYAIFILASATLGMGAGFIDSLLSAIISDLYDGEAGTKMMNLLHTIFCIAAVLVPSMSAFAASAFVKAGISWSTPYLIVGILGALALLYLMISSRNIDTGTKSGDNITKLGEKMSAGLIRRKWKQGTLPGLILGMILHDIFFGGFGNWITRYITRNLGDEIGNISVSMMWLGVLISRILVPILKINPKRYLCSAGFLTCAIVLVALPFENGLVMCIAGTLVGLVFGAMLPCIINIGCEASMENTLLGTTVLSIGMKMAGVIQAPMTGQMEGTFGLKTTLGIISVFIALSSLVFILTPGVGRKTKEIK